LQKTARKQLQRRRSGGARAASGGSCSGGGAAAHRQRAEATAAAETWRRTGSKRRQLQRRRRGQKTRTPRLVELRAGDAPGSTPAGGAHRTTKKQEGHRTSEYQLAGRCARQARSRQNYATQGRIKPQGRRYVDSSPEKAGASTDLHAGSGTANLQ
jgi:hypothetical protein